MRLSDNFKGALLMMLSMACFTLNDAAIKAMAGAVPLSQIAVLRGVVTSVFIAGLAWHMGVLAPRLSRRDWGLVALRTGAEVLAAFFFLTALVNMPIANVTAILQALPLTVTLAAALVFREQVGWRRMLAILVGLVGVMLIVRPGAEDFNAYSVYALCAVACVTVRDLSTRRLSKEVPSMFVTLVTSVAVMVGFGVLSLGDTWAPMGPREGGLLAAASLFIVGGYLFSIMVMRVGEIGFVAPFRYTGLIWAMGLGLVFFDEWPTRLTLLGAAIVVGSGLFTLYRETQSRRKTPLAQPSRRH